MNAAQLALLTDVRLSETARVLGLYIASLGEGLHELGREDFRRVLGPNAGKDRIARALTDLEHYGYVTRKAGGQRPDSFGFCVRDSRTEPELSVRESRTQSEPRGVVPSGPVGTGPQQINNPPPPTPTARVDDLALLALRKWLGPFAVALDLLDVSAAHSPGWPGMIWGWYRPPGDPPDAGGTQWGDLADLPSLEGRRRALADAITDFSGTGKPLAGDHFRGYVRKAVRNEHNRAKQPRAAGDGSHGRSGPRHAASAGGGPARRSASAAQPAGPSPFPFRSE